MCAAGNCARRSTFSDQGGLHGGPVREHPTSRHPIDIQTWLDSASPPLVLFSVLSGLPIVEQIGRCRYRVACRPLPTASLDGIERRIQGRTGLELSSRAVFLHADRQVVDIPSDADAKPGQPRQPLGTFTRSRDQARTALRCPGAISGTAAGSPRLMRSRPRHVFVLSCRALFSAC